LPQRLEPGQGDCGNEKAIDQEKRLIALPHGQSG
jgi:hypothetical protein